MIARNAIARGWIVIMSKQKVFIDTNIFLYSFDISEPVKRVTAMRTINNLNERQTVVISTQVMQEFYHNFTRKRNAHHMIAEEVTRGMTRFEVTTTRPQDVLEAIRISQADQISFWDALIIAAAVKTNCSELYTEDLNNGQVIQGVKVVNPFV